MRLWGMWSEGVVAVGGNRQKGVSEQRRRVDIERVEREGK